MANPSKTSWVHAAPQAGQLRDDEPVPALQHINDPTDLPLAPGIDTADLFLHPFNPPKLPVVGEAQDVGLVLLPWVLIRR